MSIRTALASLAPLLCMACATTAAHGVDLDVTGSAVVTHPGFDVFTISGNHASIPVALADAELMGRPQVLVSSVIYGSEPVEFPAALVRDGEATSLYVGGVDEDGGESGVELDIIVTGETATLHARELAHGDVIAEAEAVIPVTAMDE